MTPQGSGAVTGLADAVPGAAPAAPSAEPPLLAIRGLRTWFHTDRGVVRAVDGVDLEIAAGRTLCLVGESGCGKSTLAMSIPGLVDRPGRIMPGSRIEFMGTDLVTLPERQLRHVRGGQISVVFQEPMTSLNPVMTVGEQIAESVRVHQGGTRQQAMGAAADMLARVGLPDVRQRLAAYPHELSGGQRQRVMIAIALACRPKLLIADEPTTALDVTIQAQILDLLADLGESFGMAMLFVTHDFGVVSEIADEVAVMYGGKVVEQGSARDVLDNPTHPYTQALLDCTPQLGMHYETLLRTIAGQVPDLRHPPRGCVFQPRCPVAIERCATDDPPFTQRGSHRFACWVAAEHGDAR